MLDPSVKWPPERLDAMLRESPSIGYTARWIGKYAVAAPDVGVPWVRSRVMDPSLHENVRVHLGCSLAEAGLMDEAMAAFMSALLRDSNCAWTRMFAAESLGGPWGVPYLDVLVESLRDRK